MILIRITNTFSIIDLWEHHSIVDREAKCSLYNQGPSPWVLSPGTWVYDDNICFKHLDASVMIKNIIKINIYICVDS